MAFAAGSGITPVLSLIKTTLATEPKSRFTLIFGNRSRQDIIFLEELEALKNKYPDRFQLLHILSREKVESSVLQGRINTEKLEELSRFIPFDLMDEFFVCGPEKMIFAVKNFLEGSGIDRKKIHFELFTTPGQTNTTQKTVSTQDDATPKSTISMKLDGRTIEFQIPKGSDQTLLDAALASGADLPYACKGGVCCTCKAKLVQGDVHMDVHWGLGDEEIKRRFYPHLPEPSSLRISGGGFRSALRLSTDFGFYHCSNTPSFHELRFPCRLNHSTQTI
ncbi:MAG: 2Fe-2S iron-sulfur cluster-binding protein [Chitinophagaceae bacterium]|nr:2Fe-2S iron-sulfur cluster-binding protein [Chitinophagaceae bacterium]